MADPTARRHRIMLLNGLNMTNLGRRDPHIYGRIGSLAELEELVRATGDGLGVDVIAVHANDEGALVDAIEGHDDIDGYLINPGGLWAYGLPTRIALTETGRPTCEVHFANIYATGHESIFTETVRGTVMGAREHGYVAALVALVALLDAEQVG
jgi:3-dehydroquinate dehydratase II